MLDDGKGHVKIEEITCLIKYTILTDKLQFISNHNLEKTFNWCCIDKYNTHVLHVFVASPTGADNGRVSTEAELLRGNHLSLIRWTNINSVCRSCVRRKEGGMEDSRITDGNNIL